jgi:hypothetical protein
MDLIFCLADMPGSSDDNAIDKILNCIIRSNALRQARSVCPVLVLKFKGYDANRFQNARSEIEFIASCFNEPKHFTQILVLVTHADENQDDRYTLGKLRNYIKKIPRDIPWAVKNALDLHTYLISEFNKALGKLEKGKVNDSNIRVVRPLLRENRDEILEFLDHSFPIESPSEVFRFNLEEDAEKLVNSVMTREHENVCMWLTQTFEYEKVVKVISEMNQVLQALGKFDQMQVTIEQVMQANALLHNNILRVVLSLLNAPLEGFDVQAELTPLVARFKDMQVISDSKRELLRVDEWKSFSDLIHDNNEELSKYIYLEKKKSSWEALGGCAERLRLLSCALECEEAEKISASNITDAIQSRVQAIRKFDDPVKVADAMVDLEKGCSALKGIFHSEASEQLETIKQFIIDEVEKLVQQITDMCQAIEKGESSISESEKEDVCIKVTQLYKFTRVENRIDKFFPPHLKSDSEGGFYKKFLSGLELEEGSCLDRTRLQLLQHYNLLECLLKVEDEELHAKIKLHIDSLKSNIDNVVEEDYLSLKEAYGKLFPKEIVESIGENKMLDSVDGRVLTVKHFWSAFSHSAQLLRVDVISGDKLCSSRLVKFLELYSVHISELEFKIKRGNVSIPSIEQCLSAFLTFNHSAIDELSEQIGIQSNGRLRELLENIQQLETQCSRSIQQMKFEECKKIEETFRGNFFVFNTSAGLKAYDETLVKLKLLILIQAGEKDENSFGVGNEGTDCRNLYASLEQQFSKFLDEQRDFFKFQGECSASDLDFDILANAYKNLIPYAQAECFCLTPRDTSLMNKLTNRMKNAEEELVQLGEERLDHCGTIRLLRNLNRAIRWRQFECAGNDPNASCCLKEVRSRIKQTIDQDLQAVDSDLQEGKFDKVAIFWKQCCEADKSRIIEETAHRLKTELKNVQRCVRQIRWLDMAQIPQLGSNVERIQQCKDSALFSCLPESLQDEIQRTCELVQNEVSMCSKGFREVLDRVIAKTASYGECDNYLKVILGMRECLPEFFSDALSQFNCHKDQIKAKFESIDSADDADLQQLANDVIETMFELNVHGQSHSEIWIVFSEPWLAVRRMLEPKLCQIVQRLRGRARVLAKQNADLATEMLNAHDKVRNYALLASCAPSQFPEATEERKIILNELMSNVENFQANLIRGNYKDAVGIYKQFTNETRMNAKSYLEQHIDHLIKEGNLAFQSRSQHERFSRHYEQLQLLKKEFLQSKCEQMIITNIEYFLQDTTEKYNAMVDSVRVELQNLSRKDVFLPLSEWSQPLDSVKKILKFPSEIIDGKKIQIDNLILSFGTRARDFAEQQIQDIKDNARILQFHHLRKFFDNMERDSTVLKEMEQIMVLAGSPFPFRLCDIAAESKQKLIQVLDSKKAEAMKMVVAGIPDKNELSKVLSSLYHVAKDDESFNQPFNDVVSGVSSLFEQKVKVAMEALDSRDIGWGDQLNTILHTLHIGQDAFKEVPVLHRLAETCTENVLKPLRDEMDSSERIFSSGQLQKTGDVAKALIEIQGVAGEVDLMHKHSKDAVKRILARLQDTHVKDKKFMVKLGDSLAASDSAAGNAIISENPQVFQRMSNILYNEHMKDKATLDITQVMKNLEEANPGGAVNGGLIQSLYARYESKYNELIKKCIKNTTVPLPARRRQLVQELQRQVQIGPQADLVEILAVVCALYSFCKSAEYYDSAADDGCIVRPHEIQVSSMIRLLNMDSTDPDLTTRILDLARSLFSGEKKGEQDKIENHFLEIPTGEGKSIVLGITACIFALKGWDVDCVCYSKYLSARDEKDFQDVFEVLKVVKKDLGNVRYLTFAELCESHIEGIRESVEGLIYGKAVSMNVGPNQRNRVLLIDEADVFFTKRFYGNTHSPGFLLRSPEITALIKSIWENRRAVTDGNQIFQMQSYHAVIEKYASIEPLIKRATLSMVQNVQDLNNPKYAWSFNRDGKLSYRRAGGELVPATKFRHQHRTIFAFLGEFEGRNPCVTQKDLDEMLGIDIKCGDFSYAELPSRYYSMIFGVTGTLNTLIREEKVLLRTEYSITKETVIPSAYGSKHGRFDFSFENQLHVMVLDNESEWHSRIEKEISESMDVNRPVLVCFKNDSALKNFTSARPKFATKTVLDANLDDSDVEYINGIVANATSPGRVTLMTRKFGRGLDFKPNKKSNVLGGLMVIQTFFSSTESEQIQIMGRTARQGEKGAYRLVMCAEHLKDKFGYEYSDVAGSGSNSLEAALDSARTQKMMQKFEARSKKKVEADHADCKSWEFAKALYGSGSVSDKLTLLNSVETIANPMTFVLMLDVSGSMEEHYPDLRTAFETFTNTLIQRGHGSETLLTVIFFDNKAWTPVRDKPVPEVGQLAAAMPGRGTTSFSAAFNLCKTEIQAARGRDASRAFTLLFLTDGEDSSFKTSTIDRLTKDLGQHIQAYNSIGFGSGASARLAQIEEAFQHAGIRTRNIAPSNAQELVEAFATAASESGLYMR